MNHGRRVSSSNEAFDPREQHVRRLVKGCANHLIANPADTAGDVGLPRLVSLRRQSKEGPGIPGLLDPTGVIECRLVGDGDDRADTRRGHQPAADFIVADNLEHGFVQLLELLEQRGSRGQHGLSDLLKHGVARNKFANARFEGLFGDLANL